MPKMAGNVGSLEGTMATVDLPATGAPPASSANIDLSDKPTVFAIHITVSGGDAWMAMAATAAALLTSLGSDDTRARILEGEATIPVGYNNTFVGFTSTGDALTDGLSYQLIEN